MIEAVKYERIHLKIASTLAGNVIKLLHTEFFLTASCFTFTRDEQRRK